MVLLSAWPMCSDAGDVGRRDDDGVRRPLRIGLGVEEVLLEPGLHPARLDGGRLEPGGLLQVVVHVSLVVGRGRLQYTERREPPPLRKGRPPARAEEPAQSSSGGTSPRAVPIAHTWQNSSEPADSDPHCEQCCSRWPEPASTPGSSVEPGVW